MASSFFSFGSKVMNVIAPRHQSPEEEVRHLWSRVVGAVHEVSSSDEVGMEGESWLDRGEGEQATCKPLRDDLIRIVDVLVKETDEALQAATADGGDPLGVEESADDGVVFAPGPALSYFIYDKCFEDLCSFALADGMTLLVLDVITQLMERIRMPIISVQQVPTALNQLIPTMHSLLSEVEGPRRVGRQRVPLYFAGLLRALWAQLQQNPQWVHCFFVPQQDTRQPSLHAVTVLPEYIDYPGDTGARARDALVRAVSLQSPVVEDMLLEHSPFAERVADALAAAVGPMLTDADALRDEMTLLGRLAATVRAAPEGASVRLPPSLRSSASTSTATVASGGGVAQAPARHFLALLEFANDVVGTVGMQPLACALGVATPERVWRHVAHATAQAPRMPSTPATAALRGRRRSRSGSGSSSATADPGPTAAEAAAETAGTPPLATRAVDDADSTSSEEGSPVSGPAPPSSRLHHLTRHLLHSVWRRVLQRVVAPALDAATERRVESALRAMRTCVEVLGYEAVSSGGGDPLVARAADPAGGAGGNAPRTARPSQLLGYTLNALAGGVGVTDAVRGAREPVWEVDVVDAEDVEWVPQHTAHTNPLLVLLLQFLLGAERRAPEQPTGPSAEEPPARASVLRHADAMAHEVSDAAVRLLTSCVELGHPCVVDALVLRNIRGPASPFVTSPAAAAAAAAADAAAVDTTPPGSPDGSGREAPLGRGAAVRGATAALCAFPASPVRLAATQSPARGKSGGYAAARVVRATSSSSSSVGGAGREEVEEMEEDEGGAVTPPRGRTQAATRTQQDLRHQVHALPAVEASTPAAQAALSAYGQDAVRAAVRTALATPPRRAGRAAQWEGAEAGSGHFYEGLFLHVLFRRLGRVATLPQGSAVALVSLLGALARHPEPELQSYLFALPASEEGEGGGETLPDAGADLTAAAGDRCPRLKPGARSLLSVLRKVWLAVQRSCSRVPDAEARIEAQRKRLGAAPLLDEPGDLADEEDDDMDDARRGLVTAYVVLEEAVKDLASALDAQGLLPERA